MRISVIGTGYVGLVTGVCLAEIGHTVTCVDVDSFKIKMLKEAKSPIYEPLLEDLMLKNISNGKLYFTDSYCEGINDAKAIYIAVGTPPKDDGTVNLEYLDGVVNTISEHISEYTVIITKSTVPVGTNKRIMECILQKKVDRSLFDIVSNPEFLREGSAVQDTFKADRIVIGTDSEKAAKLMEEINGPFEVPIFKTDLQSAELIKYASNAFLATKISFINEIANLSEKLNANIEDVSRGMGLDKRIGSSFLNAGIGYGGSCFPKDTKALVQIAGNVRHEFELLKSVINVNNNQQLVLVSKAKKRFGSLNGLNIAVLGLAFKPNTDDMREAASIKIIQQLLEEGANIVAYDPVAINKAREHISGNLQYTTDLKAAVNNSDCIFILTEWDEIKNVNLSEWNSSQRKIIIFDGRNCYPLDKVRLLGIEYHSIGRPIING
ncbi:UDP-glucose/GDP-mannose dehydrogenase family protein [Paenibacillus sp. J31TS4]|uniref:UDP-glucose dehydrogenase family protein n=1 Tax=Paenibacillus sp. J31TS4 TaxID=2807195 RepID=UPI001BCF9356|nr:UDP-glucose/GDP-mannose dehydrogenase family protein [Paenibacillus sp. J31TS4]